MQIGHSKCFYCVQFTIMRYLSLIVVKSYYLKTLILYFHLKFPRMSEEEAIMVHARNAALYQYQAAAGSRDGAAAREAMENYMMYLSRLSLPPGFDPRLMQAYPAMFPAAQMPLLLQQAKENTVSKVTRLNASTSLLRFSHV